MPLIRSANFPSSDFTTGRWALWQLQEGEQELLDLLREDLFPREELAQIKVEQRRLEWLGCRLALQTLLPRLAGVRLLKNELGKPHLSTGGWHLSLSHAYPYAAAAVHPMLAVGIDVEQPRPQLLRVRHKFLSAEEQAWVGTDLEMLCLCWAAKEALYKLHGQAGLVFARDMQLSLGAGGVLGAKLLGKAYALHYQWHEGLLVCMAS